MIHFEDLLIGTKERFGRYQVTREEVVEFAGKYDPHPFHLSDEEAAKTFFGRISASGWHTCSMTMALFVEHIHDTPHASHGGVGIDELRWHKPVYPGDTLRCESEVIEKRRSASRPEMGIFKSTLTVFNQNDEPVMTMVSNGLIRTRDPEGTD